MYADEFAAQRSARLVTADEEMLGFVITALERFGQAGAWDDVIEAASVLWLEAFSAEAPDAYPDAALRTFQRLLRESLAKTSTPADPVELAQVERVTMWLGTVCVNDAAYHGNRAVGALSMRWISMHDGDVRSAHARADGQEASVNGTFSVGGYQLRYPGEPVGPPEVWINCRCLLAAGRVRRRSPNMSARATTFAPQEIEDLGEADDVAEVDVEGEDLVDEPITEIPVHGVAAPEGVPTGDGRMFAIGALANRDLPLPIRYEVVGTHGGSTSDVVTVGRIDELWMDEQHQMRYRGVLMANREYTDEVTQGIVDGTVRGISVEVDDMEVDMAALEAASDEAQESPSGKMPLTVFTKARIAGFTIVPIPAYMEAYIGLGHEFPEDGDEAEAAALLACGCTDEPTPEEFASARIVDLTGLSEEQFSAYEQLDPDAQEAFEDANGLVMASGADAIATLTASAAFAPGTKDGPGWITNPKATARIRRYWTHGKGAAKIRWGAPGDFNRCRSQLAKYVKNPDRLAGTCANMHKEALGFWPAEHHATKTDSDALFALTASAFAPVSVSFFDNPELTGPTPLTIEGDHVYGHLAAWGVCHIGMQNACITAPHSAMNYAMFRTGAVETDAGEVAVGQITLGTGHAGGDLSAAATMAHYDDTGTAVADVASGEDAFGIWFSGRIRDSASEQTRQELRASALSGDWRRIAGNLELVSALAVNVPGYPIPRPSLTASASGQNSLVAAGIVETVDTLVASGGAVLSAADIAGIARLAVDEYRHQEKRSTTINAVITPLRAEHRAERIAMIRAEL